MFRATMCPSSGADDCEVLLPHAGIVPWLQEGCQNRLAGSVFIEGFVAQRAIKALLRNTNYCYIVDSDT